MSAQLDAQLQTVVDFIRYAVSRMEAAGVCYGHGTDNAVDEACYLIGSALHLPLPIAPEFMSARLMPDEASRLHSLITRRVEERVPVAYLTGRAWFAGLEFKVSADTLIPRSPIAELLASEQLAMLAPAQEPERILDLCTGSGCIAIALAYAFDEATVDAVDISPAALAVAQDNIAAHELGERVHALQSDLFESLAGERYDLIVTNPPYVSAAQIADMPAEFGHEPGLGLAAGEDGMGIVLKLLLAASDHLSPAGLLLGEVGINGPLLDELLASEGVIWPALEQGGEGLFLIDAETLSGLRPRLQQLLDERGLTA